MSSGSRDERLEALLSARYALECCEESEKHIGRRQFESCIAEILGAHPKISRSELLEAIGDRYREFRAARLKAQRRRETL